MEGYIKLHRCLLEDEVFSNQKELKIWIWLLIKANYKDRFVSLKIARGESTVELKRGQLLFGRFSAEEELCIDGSTIYKIIKKFAEKDMIKLESNSHYTVITIYKYDTYQQEDVQEVAAKQQPSNIQVTSKQQPSNTPKKDNKDKKEKENINTVPNFSEFKIFALEKKPKINQTILQAKYDSWVIAGWVDGNGNKIKNWKSKLLNTIPYIPEVESKHKFVC